jgi:hypothetical protein
MFLNWMRAYQAQILEAMRHMLMVVDRGEIQGPGDMRPTLAFTQSHKNMLQIQLVLH